MLELASGQASVISDDMRRVRIAGDIALSRSWPGWFCAMFHSGQFVEGRWLLVYSVMVAEDSQPIIVRILIGRVKMADGSQVWAWVQ